MGDRVTTAAEDRPEAAVAEFEQRGGPLAKVRHFLRLTSAIAIANNMLFDREVRRSGMPGELFRKLDRGASEPPAAAAA